MANKDMQAQYSQHPPTVSDRFTVSRPQSKETDIKLSSLELSEQEINTEILPLIKAMYHYGDTEIKKIAIKRLTEIQNSILAHEFLDEIVDNMQLK